MKKVRTLQNIKIPGELFGYIVWGILSSLLIAACVGMGVASRGIEYFVGKSENVLVKYFGGEASSVDDTTGEFDKILWFTNKEIAVLMTRENVMRYKVPKRETVYSYNFKEYSSDGCRFSLPESSGYLHYDLDTKYDYPNVITYLRHNQGENRLVNSRIEEFNNQVRRYRCIDTNEENAYINRSNIGDIFYVVRITKQEYLLNGIISDTAGNMAPREVRTTTMCTIYRVTMTLKEEIETERHTPVRYLERTDSYYDSNWNVLSEERADEIINAYINRDFDSRFIATGLSLLAYIKDGIVVRVEDFAMEQD